MHIDDGILPLPIVAAGAVAAAAMVSWSARGIEDRQVPRVALVTSALFVASLVSLRMGPLSVHLSLAGLAGVLLGRAGPAAVAVGVGLQAAAFHHGGLTTLGVNALTMGSAALVASWLAPRWSPGCSANGLAWRAGLAASVGTLASIALYGGALLSAGEALRVLATGALLAHLPLVVIEGAIAALATGFLARVDPSALPSARARPAAAAPRAPADEAHPPGPVGSLAPGAPPERNPAPTGATAGART